MGIKISPFNFQTVKKYGATKLEEIENGIKKQEDTTVISIHNPEVTKAESVVVESTVETTIPDIKNHIPKHVVEILEKQLEEIKNIEEEITNNKDENIEEMELEDLRNLAKSLNIEKHWMKSRDRLIKEIRDSSNKN